MNSRDQKKVSLLLQHLVGIQFTCKSLSKENVDLCIHTPIELHDIVLNKLSTGTNLLNVFYFYHSVVYPRDNSTFP